MKYLLSFCLIIVVVVILYKESIEKSLISSNKEITLGYIYDYSYPAKAGIVLHFFYVVSNDTFYGKRRISASKGDEFYLLRKNFPVVYSKNSFSLNRILLFPDHFKEFNLSFPDSLNWVKKYDKF